MNILYPIFHPRRAVQAIARAEEQTARIAGLEAEKAALDGELTASCRGREEAERQAALYRERLEQVEQALQMAQDFSNGVSNLMNYSYLMAGKKDVSDDA